MLNSLARKLLAASATAVASFAFALMSASAQAANPQVEFVTSEGRMVIELFAKEAPITSRNFLKYVDAGYFTGTIFHRVIPGFVIQGGGFEGKSGSNLKTRTVAGLDTTPIKNEANNGLKNEHYTLSMARTSDPDSATSQFFINLRDNGSLDYSDKNPGYAVFGKVVEGEEVVYKIATTETTTVGPYKDVPVTDIKVTSAKIL